jgi:hypothetical protein
VKDKSVERNVAAEPTVRSWKIIAAGSVVPLGSAVTAAVTTYLTSNEKVACTAWITAAVVGTVSVISALLHLAIAIYRWNVTTRAFGLWINRAMCPEVRRSRNAGTDIETGRCPAFSGLDPQLWKYSGIV